MTLAAGPPEPADLVFGSVDSTWKEDPVLRGLLTCTCPEVPQASSLCATVVGPQRDSGWLGEVGWGVDVFPGMPGGAAGSRHISVAGNVSLAGF